MYDIICWHSAAVYTAMRHTKRLNGVALREDKIIFGDDKLASEKIRTKVKREKRKNCKIILFSQSHHMPHVYRIKPGSI